MFSPEGGTVLLPINHRRWQTLPATDRKDMYQMCKFVPKLHRKAGWSVRSPRPVGCGRRRRIRVSSLGLGCFSLFQIVGTEAVSFGQGIEIMDRDAAPLKGQQTFLPQEAQHAVDVNRAQPQRVGQKIL